MVTFPRLSKSRWQVVVDGEHMGLMVLYDRAEPYFMPENNCSLTLDELDQVRANLSQLKDLGKIRKSG